MKLLMTADTVGGVWTYMVELARALAGHGVEIALATMGKRLSIDQRNQLRALSNVTLHESEYKLEWMENPWADVDAAGEWLLHIEKRLCPDLIHLNGYAHAALPWSAPKVVVCHSCVLSWWLAVHGTSAPVAEWACYRERVRQGLRAADFIVAPTRAMLASIFRLYGSDNVRTRVIPNARDAGIFAPGEKKPLVFSAGRIWDAAKNIAALEHISHSLTWPVFVAGNEAHPQRESRAGATTSNFHTLGCLANEDIARWMSEAAIYCLPARYEPFGLAVLEAALSGCALVLGDIPSLRENWDGAAIFVDPADETELTTSINSLIENQTFRERCARRARLRALDFTPARMAAAYLSVYGALLANSASTHSQRMEASACAS